MEHEESSYEKLKTFVTEKRDQFGFGLLFTIASAALGLVIAGQDPVWIIVLLNFGLIGLFLLQRASVGASMKRLRHIVVYDLGVPWLETQYHKREKHFVDEKHKLAEALVRYTLPRIFDHASKSAKSPTIRLILDSGTTIVPIFEQLVRRGLQNDDGDAFKPEIYTNNLAGIFEVQKLDYLAGRKLTEEDFTLLGGTPLGRYRATTGDLTLRAVEPLFDKTDAAGHPVITVGVLTANWLLVGKGHASLALCARGRGHPEFKRVVATSCTHLVIVAPLGKILALSTAPELNVMLPREERRETKFQYEDIPIPVSRLATTYLLTTRRPEESESPLQFLSDSLFRLEHSARENFIIDEDCPGFNPTAASKDELRDIELPHEWTRKHVKKLFG
jgi:hypothetical protein